MKVIGVCIGSSTITRVDIENKNGQAKILEVISKVHEGNVKKTFENLFAQEDFNSFDRIAVTGRKFKNFVKLSSISEPEAIEYAYSFLKDKYGETDYISCAGGETFTTYQIDSSDKVNNLFTGNKCASGTGEFFLQQIKRMGITHKETDAINHVDKVYEVSGRCSVFCKSDCTHALNKGEDKNSIVAGLCNMMALRILEHLGENVAKRVWLLGGCSKNTLMVSALRQHISNLVIPEEAAYFEALGCALWALENTTIKVENKKQLFSDEKKSFAILPALKLAKSKVEFKDIKKSKAEEGDRCFVGLDVGSTTTKAVLLREKDNAILASVYIKTLGDPIKAAKFCYMSIKNEVKCNIEIVGLGVTGSGRQIAGLHALTDCVYNEISAHAAASVYFDPEVDTIFEIGGQDAKYTHIIKGIPCDYAMNEACSAGTGSFLEESASEYLNIEVHKIEDIAMEGKTPPDFNDQCAAFIGSDIKTAMQESINVKDIVAGLVYSICKNYLNRVKGSRYVGKKIFMQGGVCYNRAVPIAMASLLNRDIVVPPEPGLMGAFGIALLVKEKMQNGIVEEKRFDLSELIEREVSYDKPFICVGGNTKCDRKCNISIINIEGKKYPFGGICGKYAGVKTNENNSLENDLVKLRDGMIYEGLSRENKNHGRKKIGINRSLMVNSLFPLYFNFFDKLGFEVVVPKKIDVKEKSIVKKDSTFCYPVVLAHEYFKEMLKMDLDYIFLPHVKGMPVENNIPSSMACPLAQGEPYYLKSTFNMTDSKKMISPVLDFGKDYESMMHKFIEVGERLGVSKDKAEEAYKFAIEAQKKIIDTSKEIGLKFLEDIKKTGEKAIVVFGRPYNALTKDGNMGIPEKFASRGYKIIPFDFLPIEDENPQKKMYWSMGQLIIKAAQFVSKHPQLFGTYVTNFSCGPDSFVVGYFRDEMGEKPSLTLELDSHTADAGIDTRIDAFIDVMKNYKNESSAKTKKYSKPIFDGKKKKVRTVDGEYIDLKDPRIKVLVPSMGHISSRCLVSTLKYIGIDTVALDAPAEEELHMGRANASCKECLPLMLTVGSLLNYLKKNKKENKILVYFMPEAEGPCRFGQYHVYTERLLQKMGIKNVALLTLSSGNSYGGLGLNFMLRSWKSVVISDALENIYSAILALAVDKKKAMKVFNSQVEIIVESISKDNGHVLNQKLKAATAEFSNIKLKYPIHMAKKVAIVGEIYVRRDSFSRQHLVEKLAEKGIVTTVASVIEWIYYVDYLVKNDLAIKADFKDKLNVKMSGIVKMKYEKEIKKIFAKSNLIDFHPINVEEVIENANELLSPHLPGEAILTIGTAITDIIDHVDGIVSIGPFGCMPARIAEAILTNKLSSHKAKVSQSKIVKTVLEKYPNLPFLSIESDGNPFPQVIDIKLEAFALQVERINELVNELRG
ncbi:MAG: acyl-CoA dehydratase activase [Deltaproteobacteria bacterium]